jgi:hypothetical protein
MFIYFFLTSIQIITALRRIFFSLLCLAVLQQLNAQSLRYSLSMPYVSLGAYSSRQQDVFSFTSNQAALAGAKFAAVGVYGERRFMLEETSLYGLALALPTKNLGNFGVMVNYSVSILMKTKLGLLMHATWAVGDIGIQFNYYGYRIPAYGSTSSINFEAGALVHLTDKLNAGVHVYNPVGGKLGKESDEKLASAYKLGMGYDASDNFYFSAEIIKEEDKEVNVTGGLQYHFKKQFFARAGFMSETGSGFAGLGLAWNTFRFDISASYHPQLGFSPGLMLLYNFKKAQVQMKHLIILVCCFFIKAAWAQPPVTLPARYRTTNRKILPKIMPMKKPTMILICSRFQNFREPINLNLADAATLEELRFTHTHSNR